MNSRLKIALALVFLFAVGKLTAQNSRTLEVQFKAAQHKAEIEGDQKAAIEQFKKIVGDKGADAAVVAKVLLGMAGAYRKLGDAEAQKVYARIVRDFPGQKDAVIEAQKHLKSIASVNSGLVSREFPIKDGYIAGVSPDGRYVLGMDATMHDLVTGVDRPTELGVMEFASYSNDGKRLAYTWNSREGAYELRMLDVQTIDAPRPRTLLKLTPNIDWAKLQGWTPDNQSIVLSIYRKDSSEIALLS